MNPSKLLLFFVFLSFGSSFATPAKKSGDEVLLNESGPSVLENEVESKIRSIVSPPLKEDVEVSVKSEDPVSRNDDLLEPSITQSEDEPTFAAISGFAEGDVHNVEYGYGGKGKVAGIAGAVVNDKGLTGGAAGFAAGLAGVNTEPFKGYVGIKAEQQASFNTYGEKAEPFKHEVNSEDIKSDASVAAAPSTVNEGESKAPLLLPHHFVTAPLHVIGALLKPILIAPNLFKPFAHLGHLARPASPETKENPTPDAAAEIAPEKEEESGFYQFFRPITPTGISESIHTIFKPISSLSGQAQGSITLAGGASYTGSLPPEYESEKPSQQDEKPSGHFEKPFGHFGKPLAHVEKPFGHFEKPLAHVEKPFGHFEKPFGHFEKPNCNDKHVEAMEKPHCLYEKQHHHFLQLAPEDRQNDCKVLCRKHGKKGGSLHSGCCTCLCPAPNIPIDHPCCLGPDEVCDTLCNTNSFHNYTGGTCDAKRSCECHCNPWEPMWEDFNLNA